MPVRLYAGRFAWVIPYASKPHAPPRTAAFVQVVLVRTFRRPAPMSSRPAMARPAASGSVMALLAAKSAAADAPLPPATVMFDRGHNSSYNGWVSAFARSVAPDEALPMVRPFNLTYPEIGWSLQSIFRFPVLNTESGST